MSGRKQASTRVVTCSLFEYIGSFLLPVPPVLFAVPRPLKEYTLQNRVSCPVRFFIPSLLHSPQPSIETFLKVAAAHSRGTWIITCVLASPGPPFPSWAPFQALAPVSVGSLDIPEKSGQCVRVSLLAPSPLPPPPQVLCLPEGSHSPLSAPLRCQVNSRAPSSPCVSPLSPHC